jgi:hypothetical protein
MKNGNKILGVVVSLAVLGVTVYVISRTWRAGQTAMK